MWQYKYYSNELYHYGVKGMKWGVRKKRSSSKSLTKSVKKFAKKQTQKAIRKQQERDEQIKNSVRKRGLGLTLFSVSYKRGVRKRGRTFVAHLINSAANAYIRNSDGGYLAKQGAHYLRKAAIMGLSVSDTIDDVRSMTDDITAFKYAFNKN